jgi:hypothetical protein
MTELDSHPMSTERTIPSPPDTRVRSTNTDNGKKLRKHCDLPDETLCVDTRTQFLVTQTDSPRSLCGDLGPGTWFSTAINHNGTSPEYVVLVVDLNEFEGTSTAVLLHSCSLDQHILSNTHPDKEIEM